MATIAAAGTAIFETTLPILPKPGMKARCFVLSMAL